MKAILRRLALRITRSLLLFMGLLAACQSKLIYHPRSYAEAEVRVSNTQPLRFITADGEQAAWLLHRGAAADGKLPVRVWLVFGGNASCGLDYASIFSDAALAGDLAVLCDFPGYGRCAGHPSPASTLRTVQALVPALAAELGVGVEALRPRLRVFGHSLGCAAVLMAMREHHIAAGVLVAPFTRMLDMARQLLGWPLCEVLHHRFDNIAELRAIQAQGGARLVVFHGTEDKVIPLRMSQELRQAFPALLTLREIKGGTHNEILDTHEAQIVAVMAGL